MSLILDALRKSEAERQRRSPRSPAVEAPTEPTRYRTWLGIVTLVLLGAAAYWFLPGPGILSPEPELPSAPEAERLASDASTPPETASESPQTPAVTPAPGTPEASEDDAGVQASETPAAPEAVVDARAPEPATSVEDEPPPSPVAVELGEPTEESASRRSRDEVSAMDPNAPRWIGPDRPERDPVNPAGRGEPPSPQQPPPTRAANSSRAGVVADVPTLAQLPSALRSEIGELNLNVHVYAEEPAERFVLINFRRYGEGDSLDDGSLRVEAIRNDGVLLDYDGTTFLLPPEN